MADKKETKSQEYTVFGVQYLPDKSHQRGEHLKRTLRRMSTKRRSKSDGNLKSKLEGKTKGKNDQNGHAHSVPEVVSVDSETHSEFDSNSHGSPISANGRVEFSLDIPDSLSCPALDDVCSSLIQNVGPVETLADEDWQKYPFPYENIVMSGGGSKGYAYIGALKALQDCGVLSRVRRVGGSSAGAICGGLLAVGCSPQEIADVFFCNIKWLFQDQICGCCFCLPKILKSYGINPGIRFQEIYGNHLAKKVGNPDITFLELYRDYDREFCVVVTNLCRMCSEYCHWTTTPDLPIRKAVRMSMAFPVVYEPVTSDAFGQEHLYMDGGTLDQFPVHCFDGPLLELNHNMETGQKRSLNEKTIGINLVSECPIDYKIWESLFGEVLPNCPLYLPDTKLARSRLKEELKRRSRADKTFDAKKYVHELKTNTVMVDGRPRMRHYELENKQELNITNFSNYCKASLSTVIVSQRRLHVKPEDINRTVAVNCGYIGTNDYVIEPDDREFMIRCGYDHTKKFLIDYINRQKKSVKEPDVKTNMPRSVSAMGQTMRAANIPRSTSAISRTSKETIV